MYIVVNLDAFDRVVGPLLAANKRRKRPSLVQRLQRLCCRCIVLYLLVCVTVSGQGDEITDSRVKYKSKPSIFCPTTAVDDTSAVNSICNRYYNRQKKTSLPRYRMLCFFLLVCRLHRITFILARSQSSHFGSEANKS